MGVKKIAFFGCKHTTRFLVESIISKYKIDEIPENLIEEEIKILSHGFKEDEAKEKRKEFEKKAKVRIKVGLILNEFGEQNKIKVEENEIQGEIQKQLRTMPGQEKLHYSPGIPITLNCKTADSKDAFIVFGKKYKNGKNIFNLSYKGDLKEAGKNLYKTMRKIKNLNFKKIRVVKIPNRDIGIAINDRLTKASNK